MIVELPNEIDRMQSHEKHCFPINSEWSLHIHYLEPHKMIKPEEESETAP